MVTVSPVTMQLTGTHRHRQRLNWNIPSWRIGVRTCSPAWTYTWTLSGNSLQTCFGYLGTDTSKWTPPGWKFSLWLWGRLCHYLIYYFDCIGNKLQIITGPWVGVCVTFCRDGDTICHAIILSVWHSSWCPASVISEVKLIKTIADYAFCKVCDFILVYVNNTSYGQTRQNK